MTKAGTRWLNGVIGVGLFLLTMAAFFRPPLLPEIGRDLGMSALGLGLLGSVFALGRLAADFPAGRMTDRIRPGFMMSLSAAVVAVGGLVLATAPTSIVAYVAMFLLGLGSTFTMTTGMAHFARAPRIRRGAAMSAFAAWLLAGQSFGPTAGGSIGSALGWRWALGAAAVLAMVVAIGFVFVRAALPPKEVDGRPNDGHPTRLARRHELAILYLLPAIQFAVGGAILQTLIPIVADAELGIGPGAVGLALGIGGISRFVAAIASGQIADRVSRKWALLPGQVLQVLGLVTLMLGSSRVTWFASILLVTLGSTGVNVGATILADLSEGSDLGGRLGAFRFTGDAAFVAAPLLSGWLYEISGRAVATLPLVVLAAVVTLAVSILPETGADLPSAGVGPAGPV